MRDKVRTKEELLAELESLRQRVAQLEAEGSQRNSTGVTDHSRVQELDALFTVASILVQPGGLEEKARRVLHEIAAAVQSEWVALRVYDEQEQGLKLVAAIGSGLEEVPPVPVLRGGQLMSGIAFQQGAPVVVNDYASYSNADPGRIAQGMKSGASVLIRSGGQVIGSINVNSNERDHFTPERVRFLTAISDGMGVLLENAGLVEALRKSEQEARRLAHENAAMAEIGRIIGSSLDTQQVYDHFAEEVRKLIPFDRISIGVVNVEEGTFTDTYYTGLRVPGRDFGTVNQLANSVTEQVVNSKAGMIVEMHDEDELTRQFYLMKAGYQSGLRSSLSAPLISNDQVIAVLHIQSTEPDAYDEQSLGLAERVGSQIAGAIANSLLFDELRRTQEGLRQSEERLRALVQAVPVPVVLTRVADGHVYYANEHMAGMFGFPPDELVGAKAPDLYYDPADRGPLVAELKRHGRIRDAEVRARNANGEPFWVNVSAQPTVVDGQDALLTAFTDVTERKRAEELFKTLAQSSPVGIFLIEDGKFSFVNDKFQEETGLGEEELVGQDSMNLVISEDRKRVQESVRKMLRGDTTQPYEFRAVTRDGEIQWLMGTVAPIDYEGKQAIVGSYMNITERRRGEELFRTLAQSSPVGIFVMQDGKFSFVNAQALADSGYSEEELLGQEAISYVEPEDQEHLRGLTDRLQNGERLEPFEYRIMRKDGSTWWILGNFAAVSYEGRPAVIGTYMDITDRKQAEQKIRETLEEKEVLLEEIQLLYSQERRRANQFQLIDEVGRKITSILDVDELLKQVAGSIQEAFGYHHVGIGMIERDEVVYKVGAGALADDSLPPYESLSFKVGSEGITGYVAATGEPVVASDVRANPHYVRVRHSETRSELAVPIRVKGRVIGVLDVQSDQLNAFDDTDLTVLQSLADQTGISIDNARLFAVEQAQLEHMKAINDVAVKVSSIFSLDELLPFVVNLLYQTFDPYSVHIELISEETGEMELRASAGRYEGEPPVGKVFKMDEEAVGLCSWVARTGKYVVANDVSKEPLYNYMEELPDTKSELAVPISIGEQVIGVLDIESDRLNAFSEISVSTALNIANQLAIAIENARLLDETRDVAVLEERNRMAREIHDTMAQGFTGIVLQLEAAEQAYDENPSEMPEHLERAKNLARECLQEARRSVWNLLPRALEEKPLAGALEEEISRFSAAGREKASFSVSGARRELPSDVQAALLRICQESLTNVRKHARATEVNVALEFRPDAVCLIVNDNGVGIVSKESSGDVRQGGFGLNGMEQRAHLLRGTLVVTSGKGEGTRVEAVIPTT